MKFIGQNLFALRQQAGLTQVELALACGIAQPNIAAFERGQRKPSWQSLERLARGLGRPVESLLTERKEAAGLDRHDFESIAVALALGKAAGPLDAGSWQDLQALFHSKLRALYPAASRRRPRIRASAALQRLNALYTPSFVDRLDGRFHKLNLERA